MTIPGNDPRIMTVDGVQEGRWCAAMWCPFAGTSVKLIGNTGPAGGMADVYIDGIWQQTVDWYSEEPVTDATLFDAANLADGKHLLGVLTRGDKRAGFDRGPRSTGRGSSTLPGRIPIASFRSGARGSIPTCRCGRTTSGEPVQCHMGGIMYHDGKYYMVGGDWGGKVMPGFPGGWGKNLGMIVYSSPDLMNWTYHGNFCGESNDPKHPLYDYAHGAGRGKLIRARGTGKFVALFQVVGATSFGNVETCEMNATAVAVADRPEGPYHWHGFLQMDGKRVQGSDTAVFTDDDGTQYFICALSDPTAWNVSDCIYELARRLPQRGEGQAGGYRRRGPGHLQARRRLLPAALAVDGPQRQQQLLPHGHEHLGPVAGEGQHRRGRPLGQHVHDPDDRRGSGDRARKTPSSGLATASATTPIPTAAPSGCRSR